ncbi:MAG: phenylalanine--tRNA ligase subunit beta [Treponema sp.]|jgi:phenylalanyl-tRNA synthetase beta chain|nr:phenylalanine--tRNA ligase subunit beta [Treponema sp.]
MPKIEVNEEAFYSLAGFSRGRNDALPLSREELEETLSCAKAELDSDPWSADSDKSIPFSERILKIELNDTNRPDLWGTAGCARQLRIYNGGIIPEYSFFSWPNDKKKAGYRVIVEASVKQVRPYRAGVVASATIINDPRLRDMIQTQEKLAWNFGRKRRTISMGLYRISRISWPIIYKGVDPDSISFVPRQWEGGGLTLREILKQHPKGKEYAFILEQEPIHPLLTDSQGFILSYPPIINSNDLGAVQAGDSDIFVELTGADQMSLSLAASIVACDLSDNGFTIEPVEIDYEFDTPFGRECITPYYFQEPVFCSLARIEKFLGEAISTDDCIKALARMGVRAEKTEDAEYGKNGESKIAGIRAWPPEYRNDYLHAADVMEDIMIGRGLSSFKPERPRDFTMGRLGPVTVFSRRIKEIMAGLAYQEMIYNYLGSRKDLADRMQRDDKVLIRISNPMTENYEYVRDSILPSLLQSESVSAHAVYPHRIFETGKTAYLEESENYGSVTRQYLGFLHAGTDANFNTLSAELQTLFYYLSRTYEVEEKSDSRFIPGRAAAIMYRGRSIGVFGEIHPEVLENWGITVPCTACELDVEVLLEQE